MNRLRPNPSPPQVWAAEDTSVQICWGDLPHGPVRASSGSSRAEVDHGGGSGALDLTGLRPGRSFEIDLRWTGGRMVLEGTTVATPPGELLTRFATISDLHLGARRWGALRTMRDRSGHPIPHPYRCAAAAVAEARGWGASFLVIKGDTVENECREHFAQVADLVDSHHDLPMLMIPGNHDVDGRPGGIPATLGARRLPFIRHVDHVDLPGIRIVGADTTIDGRGPGTLDGVAEATILRADAADRPVFLAIHQQLQPTRLPRSWPAGIPAPQSTRFLDQLDRLRQPIVVSSGHTHRNRSRRHRSVLVTEVASTKDWPGVWAGYAVHEGGIRQVVRRVAAPEAIRWTEYSRGALGGLWAHWSPGPFGQRNLSHPWAERTSLV